MLSLYSRRSTDNWENNGNYLDNQPVSFGSTEIDASTGSCRSYTKDKRGGNKIYPHVYQAAGENKERSALPLRYLFLGRTISSLFGDSTVTPEQTFRFVNEKLMIHKWLVANILPTNLPHAIN